MHEIRSAVMGAIAAGFALASCGTNERAVTPQAPASPPPAASNSATPIAIPPPGFAGSAMASAAPTSATQPPPDFEDGRSSSAPPPIADPAKPGGGVQIVPSATPSASASAAPHPTVSRPVVAPRTCAMGKPEKYCVPPGTTTPRMIPNPTPPQLDANRCASGGDIQDSCAGIEEVQAGPGFERGQCCYAICRGTVKPCGRPFVVDNRPEMADAVPRRDWSAGVARAPGRWLDEARAEHASIASFARLALDLLAVGAPSELIAGAHRAALDEIEHARICFGLAGGDRGPGALRVCGARAPFDGPARLAGWARLAEVAAAAAEEGCCAETFAAATLAGEGSRIARDEARHAALAWKIVAWAIATGGDDVREAVEHAFARGLAALGCSRAADEARREIIVPAAERLLS